MLSRIDAHREHPAGHMRISYGAAITLISILCLVVVGLDLFRTWEERARQLESARREVANLSWAVGEHAEVAFQLATRTVGGLAERLKTEGTNPERFERLDRLMAEEVASSPVLQSLSVVDENGVIVADSRPALPAINVSDRAYFQYERTHDTSQPWVSSVLLSRVSGKSIISVSIRLNHADGSFAGVLVASVEASDFQNFYATLDLGHEGIAALYRDDGILLVRHPFVEAAVGSNVGKGVLFQRALPAAPSGTFDGVSVVDGVRRITGYRRVAGFPLVVVAGLGVDEQLAAWRTNAAEHLLAAVVIALLLGFIGVRLVTQVHQLTRAEQATGAAMAEARTSAARYRLIADNASDTVVTINTQFVLQYVSPGCKDLLGYEPEELIGGPPLSLVHPGDVERVSVCLRGLLDGRDRDSLIARQRHREGHWVWVEVSLRLLRDPDGGAPIGICAALCDITQRLAAETALRERERELERSNADLREMTALSAASRYARNLLEASLDPMVTISPEGKITDVNEATVKVTGVPRGDLIGTDFCDYFTEPEQAREGYRRVFAEGSVTDFPLTIRNRNEVQTGVLYNASVYKDDSGAVLGVFAAARDMTALTKAEREIAEQRGKELERLEELELYHRLTVGRELKMIDLKKEIAGLLEKLAAGTGVV